MTNTAYEFYGTLETTLENHPGLMQIDELLSNLRKARNTLKACDRMISDLYNGPQAPVGYDIHDKIASVKELRSKLVRLVTMEWETA